MVRWQCADSATGRNACDTIKASVAFAAGTEPCGPRAGVAEGLFLSFPRLTTGLPSILMQVRYISFTFICVHQWEFFSSKRALPSGTVILQSDRQITERYMVVRGGWL